MAARRELVLAISERYQTASSTEKRRILDEFTAVTGYHRKHAIRDLSRSSRRSSMRWSVTDISDSTRRYASECWR